MKSLIDDILTLEDEANQLLESARATAKEIDKASASKQAAIREEIMADVERRVATFREEAERKHQEDIVRAKAEHEAALAALDQIVGGVISEQADAVVAQFRESLAHGD